MASPPAAMRRGGRHVDPHFHTDEHLLLWEDPDDELPVGAVELPDMSVGRSKYGHAEWVRFDVGNHRHFEDWGVIAFRVGDIPTPEWKHGTFRDDFRPCHEPLDSDYPHSEVRAFENDVHITEPLKDLLPEDVHLKWREKLLRQARVLIKRHQRVIVRQSPPVSHKLESHAVEA